MGRYALSLTPDQLKVWTDMIDWLVQQDGFVIIGTKDNEVNAKSSVDLEEALELVSMVYDMLNNSLESGAPEGLLTLQ
jgi:hypothetical protein